MEDVNTLSGASKHLSINKRHILMALCFALFLGCYAFILPMVLRITGVDWNETYAPAARALASGHNPYLSFPTLHNPVWILIPLIPLAYLPAKVATYIALFLTVAIYLWVGYKFRATPITMMLFMLSPAAIQSLQFVNVDCLVLLGFTLPAPIGLFFVLAKPQIGIAMVPYWLVQAWLSGGFRKVILTFAPISCALILSFVIFGNWIATSNSVALVNASWSTSLFPWGIPMGLALLGLAFRSKKKGLAASASPFFAPYISLPSWSVALVGLFDHEILMALAVIVMWIFTGQVRPLLGGG